MRGDQQRPVDEREPVHVDRLDVRLAVVLLAGSRAARREPGDGRGRGERAA